MNKTIILEGFLDSYNVLQQDNDPSGGNGVVRLVVNNDSIVVKMFNVDVVRYDHQIRLERFDKEIEFLRKYKDKNDHIPHLIDSYKRDKPFFVMKKYLTIKDFYRTNPSFETLLKCGLQLIEAIKFLHSEGYAHRDIKPNNLLFEKKSDTDDFNLILTDFGLILGKDDKTQESRIIVSSFNPPELRDRTIEVTDNYFSSDVYQFGKTMYALLKRATFSFDDSIERIDRNHEIRVSNFDPILLEPIYEMIEGSIKFKWYDRISIEDCENKINETLKLLKEDGNRQECYLKQTTRRAIGQLLKNPEYIIREQDIIENFFLDIISNKPVLTSQQKSIFVKTLRRIKNIDSNSNYSFYEIKDLGDKSIKIAIKELIYSKGKKNHIYFSIASCNELFEINDKLDTYELSFQENKIVNPFVIEL